MSVAENDTLLFRCVREEKLGRDCCIYGGTGIDCISALEVSYHALAFPSRRCAVRRLFARAGVALALACGPISESRQLSAVSSPHAQGLDAQQGGTRLRTSSRSGGQAALDAAKATEAQRSPIRSASRGRLLQETARGLCSSRHSNSFRCRTCAHKAAMCCDYPAAPRPRVVIAGTGYGVPAAGHRWKAA